MAEVEPWDRLVALAKVSLANPVAAAVLRLHHDEYGSCAECGGESSVLWPCPTVLAIEQAAAEEEQSALEAAEFMANIRAQVAGLATGEIIRTEETPDGSA